MLNYGLTLFYNEIGKNSEALDHVELIKLEGFMFKYDIYNVKTRIFFELENPIALMDHIHTYREFIRKDNLLKLEAKNAYKNFIKYTIDLMNYKEGRNEDLDIIKFNISNAGEFTNKDWLMAQVSYLEREAAAPMQKNVYSLY
jgi:hypothetical protein